MFCQKHIFQTKIPRFHKGFHESTGAQDGVPRSPPRACSLISQSAICSTLRPPFSRTDSILAPLQIPQEKQKVIRNE